MKENLTASNKGDSCDCMVPTQTSGTIFPRIIAGGDYFFTQKGGNYLREGDYSRKAIISNIAHRKLCPKYFIYFPI